MELAIDEEKGFLAKVPEGAIFRHYKGKEYKVLQIARHSETLKLCVVYQSLYDCPTFGRGHIWVRPLEMFLETIEIEGKKQPRFQRIS